MLAQLLRRDALRDKELRQLRSPAQPIEPIRHVALEGEEPPPMQDHLVQFQQGQACGAPKRHPRRL
eukprot:7498482-Pyramimonas_sp.AAC.1